VKSKGHFVTDYGDIAIPRPEGHRDQKTRVLNLGALQETSRRLAAKLKEIVDPNEFLIVLGGDCAILIGIFGAFAARDISAGLIFFDGHADFHSKETSPTGEAADFELAFLAGYGPEEITMLFKKSPLIAEENIIVYGLREPDLIAESNIHVYTKEQMVLYTKEQMVQVGIQQSAKEGSSRLATSKLPLWFHFDVDVIDPSLVPVLIPTSNGLTFKEAQNFIIQILSSGWFLGMSIACYHPNLDTTGEAGRQISAIVSNAVPVTRQNGSF
jgi:arginase